MRWYRAEKAREKYEAENPPSLELRLDWFPQPISCVSVDVTLLCVLDPLDRLQGPARTLLLVLVAFNIGPIISKILEIAGIEVELPTINIPIPKIDLPFFGSGEGQ